MAEVTIRKLPADTHRALKQRASHNNRSTEAESRSILEEAVRPGDRVRLGSAIAALSAQAGLTNADVEALEATLSTLRQETSEPLVLE